MTKLLRITIAAFTMLIAMPSHAAMEDDPLLATLIAHQFEQRQDGVENPFVWNMQGWVGKDLNKFWFKTEGDYTAGGVEEMELQLLYSHAVAPYWDMQAGIRTDSFAGGAQRNYLAFAYQGLAPYFFESDLGLFYDWETGQSSFRYDGEYELMFTQRLVLIPELEINLYGQDDAVTRVGAGLSDLSFGLRLGYEIRREFAPYIGINWWQKFGQTANYATADGNATSGTQLVAGFRFWF